MQPPELSNVNLGSEEPRLILLGASVRAAAQSAARAGFKVTAVDLFGDTDTLAACENYVPLGESTLSTLTRLHPQRFVPLLVTGGVQGHPELISELRRRYRTLGVGVTELARIHSPLYLRQLAQAAEVRFPDFCQSGRTLDQQCCRWLLKDPTSCGGLAVRWATSPGKFDSPRCYAQRWVPGRLFGATFLGNGSSAKLLGVCRGRFTRIGDRPFVYAGSFGPLTVNSEQERAIMRIGGKIVQELQLRGLFNVDLTIDGKEIFLLEVNPRWSASCELIERAMMDVGLLKPQQSLLGLSIEGEGGELSNIPSPAPATPYLKRIVFSNRRGRFDPARIKRLEELDCQLADIPTGGRLVQAREPILSVIVKYPRTGSVSRQGLRRLLAEVQSAVR